MSRNLSSAQQSASVAAVTQVVQLVRVAFVGGDLNLAVGGNELQALGVTWYPARGLVLRPIGESADSTEGIAFELSGADSEIIALASNEQYLRRPVYVYEAWMNPADGSVIDSPRLEWVGRMGPLVIADDDSGVRITGQAEHFDAEDGRPRLSYYNTASQAVIDSTDTAFGDVEALAERVLVWPAKEALRK